MGDAATDPDEVIIAVMGVTGAGKSSFIRTVTGDSSVIVGDSLSSGTLIQRPVCARQILQLTLFKQQRKKYTNTNSHIKACAIRWSILQV